MQPKNGKSRLEISEVLLILATVLPGGLVAFFTFKIWRQQLKPKLPRIQLNFYRFETVPNWRAGSLSFENTGETTWKLTSVECLKPHSARLAWETDIATNTHKEGRIYRPERMVAENSARKLTSNREIGLTSEDDPLRWMDQDLEGIAVYDPKMQVATTYELLISLETMDGKRIEKTQTIRRQLPALPVEQEVD